MHRPERMEAKPFKLPWLDSSYQETMLPNTPWQKIYATLAKELADKVKKQFDFPERKQMIFELLGQEFVSSYFPDEPQDPALLLPPAMSADRRRQLQVEAQTWLNNQVNKEAKEKGFHRPHSDPAEGSTAPEMDEFLNHTYSIFSKGLDRHLYIQEQQLIEAKKKEIEKQFESEKETEREKNRERQSKAAELRYISASASPALSTPYSQLSRDKPSTSNVRGFVHRLTGNPPPLSGHQSEAMGNAVLAILKRDPRRFREVAAKLSGRQLPLELRKYMWRDVLFKQEREKLKDINVEKIVRERFGKSVSRGMAELRIARATQSPIGGLIENAVIEIYDQTPGLQLYTTTAHMKEAARVLNVLFVYDRSYEPYLIHWLFPIQMAFKDKSADKNELPYELTMYLALLNNSCFPKWPEVFAIAEKVMMIVKDCDPEFHDHLKDIAQKNVKVNPKEFLVQLIHQEKAKAQALLKATPGSRKSDQMSKELLADPLVFLRKWVGEGFVSILDSVATMYVWDQCFMQTWQSHVLEQICVVILFLLKQKFLEATDYVEMKKVFFEAPCRLYTMDIQRAYMYLLNGGSPLEIPLMNRQLSDVDAPPVPPPPAPAKSPAPSVVSLVQLDPVGVRNIRLKIYFKSHTLEKESWLESFDPNRLKLICSVYFGSVQLRTKTSQHRPVVKPYLADDSGGRMYQVDFPSDAFIFDDIDLSQYDVEREMGGFPYAIVRVDYLEKEGKKDSAPVPIGWAIIRLCQHHTQVPANQVRDGQTWVIIQEDGTYPLYSGSVPASAIGAIPNPPEYHYSDLISSTSELRGIVFDASKDQPAPHPQQRPPTQPRAEPVPPVTDQTEPKRPPSPPAGPWVPFKPEAALSNPAPSTHKQPYDLYIDGVRFIPDNATIVKVTGRILKSGDLTAIPDILALPDLKSPARTPRFKYRLTVNKDSIDADKNMVILLRVYTVEVISRELSVIGSCLFAPFDEQGQLKVGGHQKQLRHGMPDLSQGLSGLQPADLDNAPRIPGSSILFRVLPHVEDFTPAPSYGIGYYQSGDSKPNQSEERILNSYTSDQRFPQSVQEMTVRLQALEGIRSQDTSEHGLTLWLEERLDQKQQLQPNKPAPNLDLQSCVKYRINVGLNLTILQAYGLPEGFYVQCFGRIAPGTDALELPPTAEGHGKDEKFITLRHDFDSLQKSTRWLDPAQKIHPHFDPHSCIIVQIFGIDALYIPKPDHSSPGQIMGGKGGDITLGDEDILGWAVIPVFDGRSVFTGDHLVPVFKDKPSGEILAGFAENVPETVLKKITWDDSSRIPGGSLVVRLWDAHFDMKELPYQLPLNDYLLREVGSIEQYQAAMKDKNGKKVGHLVLDSLSTEEQNQGFDGPVFRKEKEFYEKAMGNKYYNLMETALMSAGYGPL